MTVDTKGFLLSPCKDVLLLSDVAHRALDHLIVEEKRMTYPERPAFFSEEARNRFRSPTLRLEPGLGMLSIDFTFRGEQRSMKMHFTCDCDREEYGPQSINISMGCSGFSELFVKTVLHALSMLGPVYFDACDSDAVDFAVLDEQPPTYLGAVNLGYLTGRLDLETWLKAWESGHHRDCTFEEFFGMSEELVRELQAMEDHKAAWDRIAELAKGRTETPRFLEEYHAQVVGAL